MQNGYKKIVFYNKNDIRIETEAGMPSIADDEMLVEVEACAICGSDIKMYKHGNQRVKPPRTIGHEFCGKIVKIGKNVHGYSENERVTMATTIGCGACVYCDNGHTNLCRSAKAMGFYYDGAMSKYVVIPAQSIKMNNIVPVGDLRPEIAALAEPMSCVMNGLSKAPVESIHYAVVIGLGALGMFHAMALKSLGVPNIVCVDFPGAKLTLMQDMGFHTCTPEEFEQEYLQLSEGEGFELVVITAPSKKVQSQASKYARKRGYVSYFASLPVGEDLIEISSRNLHYNELTFYGTSDSTVDHVKKGLKVLQANQRNVEKVITVLPLDKFEDGVQGVLNMQYAKVVLIP